jgi:hypothetical protein
MTISAHAATRTIAQILGATHWAGHAVFMQQALPARLATKKRFLDDSFGGQTDGIEEFFGFGMRIEEITCPSDWTQFVPFHR